MKHSAYNLFMILIYSILLFSCGQSTKPQTGVISGTLSLEGLSDHSGITVLLYSGDIVPAEIKEINAQYPQVAFPIRDWHLFDHRKAVALKSTFTSSSGAFSFPQLEYGQYIVAFYKEGWGYNYIFDINLSSSELVINCHATNAELTLKPVVEVPAVIYSEFTFQSNTCYQVNQDVVSLEGSQLIFQDSARILLAAGKKITIYGTAAFPIQGQLASITSASLIYSSAAGEIDRAEGLVVWGAINTVNNVQLSMMNNALTLRKNSIGVENVIVKDCEFGIVSYQVNDVSISKSFIANNLSPNAAAVNNYSSQMCNLDHNIFFGNYIALKHEIVNSTINDNAFVNNYKGFENTTDSHCIFEYNLIDCTDKGIENSGRSNLEISYNEIKADKCIINAPSNHGYNIIDAGWTKANFNNFTASSLAVESIAGYYYTNGPYPLDFKNNYWGVTTTEEINSLIVDFYDLGLVVGSGVSSVVEFTPFRASKVQNAGIR